ncbi:MAG: NADH-quinone oxidoreductase subunit A [Bdellovibrionales bacterium RIFOXYC1_FULL_54_43]|nr:MAG: NADH-quinone oxidoreductase subunit A [Bdellovibrionales bacterium RIFOXYC1_FULL_54_43]OFZ80924.1 MAG: NADH-quinone oxidoreductase subunit A [Bdellovibrionales bacterium RIFOXYD1_FULL_55_31]
MDYFLIVPFTLLAALFVFGGLAASFLLAPHRPGKVKNSPYECGEKTIGTSWVQFNVGYYLFALMFLVFDVEAAFLYPWALVFREFGAVALIEAGIFILVLIAGFIYAWKKGALEWV